MSGLVDVVDLGGNADVVARRLDRACTDVVFVQVVGHDVDPSIEAAAWAMAREFFALPARAKLATRIRSGQAYGYAPFAAERLAASLGEQTPPDLKETFSIGPFDVDDAAAGADPAARFVFSPNRWPAALPGMQQPMRAYYEALAALVERVMSLMAQGLGLPFNYFARSIDRHTSALRLLHYPDLGDRTVANGQLRAGAHSDYGTLTLLRQDDAPGGLQVLGVDDAWHDVPSIEGAFVLNVGDALARWTNDRWRSTVHRVAVPPTSHVGSAERFSMAFFHNANWDAEVACLPSCRVDGAEPRYPPTTAGRHLMDKFAATQAAESAGQPV